VCVSELLLLRSIKPRYCILSQEGLLKLIGGKFYKLGFRVIGMEIEIVAQEKNVLELKVDNLVVAEILRVYLNEQGVEFAAWRREHPTKPIVFRIETKSGTVKKAVSEAVGAIKKDLSKIASFVKK